MSELARPLRQEIDHLRSRAEFGLLTDVCKRALVAARHVKDAEGEAVAYLGLATAYRYTGKYAEARVLNQDGVQQLAVQIGSMELLIEGLLQAAELRLMGSFQFYEARDLYREALTMAHRGSHDQIQTQALIGLGSVYETLGMHPAAKNYAREGLGSAHLQKIHALECHALNIMGRILQHEKDYDVALRCHEQALATSREYSLKLYETESLYHIASVLVHRDAVAAINHYHQALTLAEETACLEQQYYIWGGLGEAYARSRDFVGAFNAFDRVLMTASKNQNRLQEAFAFGAMGRVRLFQHEGEAALGDFEQMQSLSREYNNPLGEAAAFEGQAQAHELLQQYSAVIGALQEARSIYVSLEDDVAVRRVTGQLVLAYLRMAWDRVLRLIGVRS